ncbi:MAG: tRNA (adenosine(37)-N6)-threonylcarbamoyltransferase complex ATPase subunit type 1 TsaE [Ferruginibacter sp.]
MDTIFSLDEIETTAACFLSVIKGRRVVAFHGSMGAGKTTFIHALCNLLLVKDAVGSPTFSIINEYKTATSEIIYHIDLYRLKDEEEAVSAGVEDALYSRNICLVEWPEKIPHLFPADTLHCYLETVSNNERKLRINL